MQQPVANDQSQPHSTDNIDNQVHLVMPNSSDVDSAIHPTTTQTTESADVDSMHQPAVPTTEHVDNVSITQSNEELNIQSDDNPKTQSIDKSTIQSTDKPSTLSVDQSNDRSNDESNSQPKHNQSDSQSIHQVDDQSSKKTGDKPSEQSNEQLDNQSTSSVSNDTSTVQSNPSNTIHELSVKPPAKPTINELIAAVDLNWCPFSLQTRKHNLILTLRTPSAKASSNSLKPKVTLRPWIRCQRASCGKWRSLPKYLNQLSPDLPETKLTIQSINQIDQSVYLPAPFHCSGNHWDIDRNVCSAVQDYSDLCFDWTGLPLKFVRHVQRLDFYVALADFLRRKGVMIREYPYVYDKPVDLFALYTAVYQLGGDQYVTEHRLWPAIYKMLKFSDKPKEPMDVDYLTEIYRSYFFEWQSTPLDFQSINTSSSPKSSTTGKPNKITSQAEQDENRQSPTDEMIDEVSEVSKPDNGLETESKMDVDT